MNSQEIRRKFLDFFEARGHRVVPSSSLIPSDPSVLLTTAGMQQFKKYYTGEADPIKDFGSKSVASVQKCFRTSDIDEVGDESHLTFFEMLGHFSFGEYFKKETIAWTYEFLTKELGISPSRISASVFGGDERTAFDEESYSAWLPFLSQERLRKGGRAGNFWGPVGTEGPCGASNEVYVDGLEVATLVFMEYYCTPGQDFSPLPHRGVDIGWGLERTAKVVQGVRTVFETDLFIPLVDVLPTGLPLRIKRIIADHVRGTLFLLSDGIRPSNKDRGYVLRRLMRRTLVYESIYKISAEVFKKLVGQLVQFYGDLYPEVLGGQKVIGPEVQREWERFGRAMQRGIKELEHLKSQGVVIDSQTAFNLYQSYGLPYEIVKDLGGEGAKGMTLESFEEEFKKHQGASRAGAARKFGGHGIVEGDLTASSAEELGIKTRLHTATHLLNAALHKVLGGGVSQRGSDITAERTRFDFVFDRKLTPEEIKKVEDFVNGAIVRDCPVKVEELPLEEARRSGALFFDQGVYPQAVKVYTIGQGEDVFSRELCGGPHVARTGEIGCFRIVKEESSSAGIRRIRGIIK